MEMTSDLDGENGICTVTVTGRFHSPEGSREIQRYTAEEARHHECRLVLVDLRGAEIVTGTMPAFESGSPKEEIGADLRPLKTAVLYPALTEHERFFETVVVNRGFSLRVFDDHHAAVEWLRNG